VREYGDRIFDQLRRLGSSVDWDRKVNNFTVWNSCLLVGKRPHTFLLRHGLNWAATAQWAVGDLCVKDSTCEVPRTVHGRAIRTHINP